MKIEEKVKIEEDFYGECAEILGTEHEYRDQVPRPKVSRDGVVYTPSTTQTRWGPRTPGNGRFPGFGLIRLFWPNTVQINLTKPKIISITIEGREQALDYLRKEVGNE